MLVTTEALYRRKVGGIRERLPDLEHVLLVGEPASPRTYRARSTGTR